MSIEKAVEKLREDEHYYGKFGKQFLSNSDIGTLLNNPLEYGKPSERIPAFLVGGYFHTAILEPEKLKNFKIVEATTRNTKKYKEISDGELCLLQHEADKTEALVETVLANDYARSLIRPIDFEYEKPAIGELFGRQWKGKADIINHDDGLIVDLKTTGDLDRFRWSAKKYNYDSQAYIYSTYFNMDMIFVTVDKLSGKIGIFDCSPQFLERGKDKVEQAIEQYRLFYKNKDFDPAQYCVTKTL